MTLVIFDLRGPLAHFRRPDTIGTHATYPFITRTALRGLAASILGREDVPPEVRCAVRLMSPVYTVAHQMAMHGKTWLGITKTEESFSRPTAIELVVQPHYRVYYAGPLAEELGERIRKGHSHYHTYLGSAYCLTFPRWVACATGVPVPLLPEGETLTCASVVPSPAVQRLLPSDGDQYARVGGMLRDALGERRFRGTVNVLYEVNGRPLRFLPAPAPPDALWQFVRLSEEETVCLW